MRIFFVKIINKGHNAYTLVAHPQQLLLGIERNGANAKPVSTIGLHCSELHVLRLVRLADAELLETRRVIILVGIIVHCGQKEPINRNRKSSPERIFKER